MRNVGKNTSAGPGPVLGYMTASEGDGAVETRWEFHLRKRFHTHTHTRSEVRVIKIYVGNAAVLRFQRTSLSLSRRYVCVRARARSRKGCCTFFLDSRIFPTSSKKMTQYPKAGLLLELSLHLDRCSISQDLLRHLTVMESWVLFLFY